MGTNARRKRGSIRYRRAIKTLLRFTVVSAILCDNNADDEFLVGQAVGLAFAERQANKPVSQAYDDHTTDFSIDDYTWTKRGEEGFRDSFRVSRREFQNLMKALRLCNADGTARVFHTIAKPGARGSKSMVFNGEQGLMVLLLRLGNRKKLSDLAADLGGEEGMVYESRISSIWTRMKQHISSEFTSKPRCFRSFRKSCFRAFADATFARKNTGLPNCIGFIDGTDLEIPFPRADLETACYSGYKKYHSIRFQGVMCPDGIIQHLYGPVEGRRGDGHILTESKLIPEMRRIHEETGVAYCVYGDPAYRLGTYVQCAFNRRPGEARLPVGHAQYNVLMNANRVVVEWGFGYVRRLFPLLYNLDALTLSTSAPGETYEVAVFLANCITCMRGNQVSEFYSLMPPSLENYVDYIAGILEE